MMKPIQELTQGEVAAFVQSKLIENGINVVLSGGACVSIYSYGKYVSLDLDLVNVFNAPRSVICRLMQEMDFFEEGRYFKHPNTKFLIEFPPGPLTIGEEPVKSIHEIVLATGILRMISPTDCVKDRLAAYYHWGDRQCLTQALLVIEQQDVDLAEIRRWSKVEGRLAEFNEIRKKLRGKTK